MTRVGKKPIPLSDRVKITYQDRQITVNGQKGTLSRTVHPAVELNISKDTIEVVPVSEDRQSLAIQGLMRSLVANMVTGVDQGFERVLEINGIGYRAEAKGNSILFNLGYSHLIDFKLPDGISATVDKKNVIRLTGIDKELVGRTAAQIRDLRPPEPYKGKGIKYAEEYIQRKAGKTGTK